MSLKDIILEKLNELNQLLIDKDADLHLKMLGVSDLFNGSPLFSGTKICQTCHDFSFEESSIWDCSKCNAKDSVCSGCCKDKDEETCYYCNYKDDFEYQEITDLKDIIEKLNIYNS